MENKWIKITDAVPELTERCTWFNDDTKQREEWGEKVKATVLAYSKERGIIMAEFLGGGRGRWSEIGTRFSSACDDITHWQPLPEKPID